MREIKVCDESNIYINGRTVGNTDPVHLFWSGSGIEFDIKATELHVCIEGKYSLLEHYIAFEVNGSVCQRIMLDGTKQWLTVFRNFEKEKITHVRIIKEVQAMSEDPEHILNIYSIKTDGDVIPRDENRKFKIEFIGDSITSGEGTVGTDADGMWIAHYFSHVRSYPYMVSNILNADYRVISKSGWGVYCAWDNNIEHNVPAHYEEICSVMPKGSFDEIGIYEKNDFSAWQPDAIVCNLGTNDDGAFHNPEYVDEEGNVYKLHMNGDEYDEKDADLFTSHVYSFLIKLRKNNPEAKLYWAFGIIESNIGKLIKEGVNRYNKDFGEAVRYIDLPCTEGEGFGSRMHPGFVSHMNSANVIANVLKADLVSPIEDER